MTAGLSIENGGISARKMKKKEEKARGNKKPRISADLKKIMITVKFLYNLYNWF